MYRIDAHQHYWNPARGDYGWLPQDDDILARAYLPADLRPELAEHGVSKTVLVQAAPSLEETEYLLGIADATASVAGVVGWVNFEDESQRAQLERLAAHPKFVGVRPMILHLEDPGWMLRPDVQWAFKALMDLDLSLDAWGDRRHLKNFHTLFSDYPDLRAVIDHCANPQIDTFELEPELFTEWADGIARIAEDTGAFCKLSGLLSDVGDDWSADDLRPVAEHVFEKFGVQRVMWGSDWPVCKQHASYGQWVETSLDLMRNLTMDERDEVFAGTAKRFYKLR